MKRFHVTTFGCQMNEHDSERMKGMLESLGYAEAPAREDVIRAHAELAAVCEHVHLPLQSGSSRILKAMRRTYDRERYLDRVAMLREHVPDCAQHPPTPTTTSGRSRLSRFASPRWATNRSSAFSRIEQVLKRMRSASARVADSA